MKGGGLGSGWSARYRTDEETLEIMNSHLWERETRGDLKRNAMQFSRFAAQGHFTV